MTTPTSTLPVEERNAIVVAHLPLARSLAWRYFYKFGRTRGPYDLDDWFQAVCLALIHAVTPSTKDHHGLIRAQLRKVVSRDVLGPLFRSSTPGSHHGVSRMAMRAGTVPLSDTDVRRRVAPSDLALLEVALDVQTLMQDATPRERNVLRATLADAFLERGKVTREDRARGRAITPAECLAKRQWATRQRKRLGLDTGRGVRP